MSYDIKIIDPKTKEVMKVKHNDLRGGTYALGGTDEAYFNITFNYACMFELFLGKGGIHRLDGKPVKETEKMLKDAIVKIDKMVHYVQSGRFNTFTSRLRKVIRHSGGAEPFFAYILDDLSTISKIAEISQTLIKFNESEKMSKDFCDKYSDDNTNPKQNEYDFDNYWAPTPGNVKTALFGLLELAKLAPDGVWSVEA